MGNKCDMDDERVVASERGRQLSEHLGELIFSGFNPAFEVKLQPIPTYNLSKVPKTPPKLKFSTQPNLGVSATFVFTYRETSNLHGRTHCEPHRLSTFTFSDIIS